MAAKKFLELANDSQKLGWVLAQLESLVRDVEHYKANPDAEIRQMMLDHSMNDAKETIADMKKYTETFMGSL